MGTSVLLSGVKNLLWDHPHAYGDKKNKKSVKVLCAGSSPRVWGQVLTLPKGRGQYGIIPTRMGTRLSYPDKLSGI